jgi:hypothetical protein
VHADIFIVFIVFETESAKVFCRRNSIQTFVLGRFSHRGAKESEAKSRLIINIILIAPRGRAGSGCQRFIFKVFSMSW